MVAIYSVLAPLLLFAPYCVASTASVERWGVFELSQRGPEDEPSFNAFTVVANVTFTRTADGRSTVVPSFYDGNATYLTRFSPNLEGTYDYFTASSSREMPPLRGTLTVTPPSASNHGPVLTDPTNPRALSFADGTQHVSVGTTSYAWMHVDDELATMTLKTLGNAPFNKIRMTLFPKFYPWTHREPMLDMFAFARNGTAPAPCTICCPSARGTFDTTRFHPPFWRRVDGFVRNLLGMGVVADIILFHPYDGGHWGFDSMGPDVDAAYLRYTAARLGAFRNVWWSLANEWSDLKAKCYGFNSSACPQTYFDNLFMVLQAADPHARRRSIHNGPIYYNHSA